MSILQALRFQVAVGSANIARAPVLHFATIPTALDCIASYGDQIEWAQLIDKEVPTEAMLYGKRTADRWVWHWSLGHDHLWELMKGVAFVRLAGELSGSDYEGNKEIMREVATEIIGWSDGRFERSDIIAAVITEGAHVLGELDDAADLSEITE